ncbi:MAG TPA: DUF3040 domain-containing protein [Streptosporangiaceae bacterium]|nr:DUF3040 domain-containing protein [Streptosporangiaceae bacterium]
MALSMEEQRILDGMEQKLADEDPRLASRMATFGQPRFAVMAGTGRGRAVILIVSLALAAIVTLMVYSMRPFPGVGGGQGRQSPRVQHSHVVSSPTTQASGSPSVGRPASPGV